VFADKNVSVGNTVFITIRPEKIKISAEEPVQPNGQTNMLKGTVEEIIYTGFQSKYFLKVGNKLIRVFKQHINYHHGGKTISWKDHAYIWWDGNDGFVVEVKDR
jgi:spermidine/putrescine transport system ATP-binding protein